MPTFASKSWPKAFGSVKKVPESHNLSNVEDYPVSSDPIPIIDLNDPHILDHLSEACRSVGAFQIVGHGVPLDFLQRFEDQMLGFFALPKEQKLKAARTETNTSGYDFLHINANFFSEGFTFSESPLEHAIKLWPDSPMPFCNVMDEYLKEMKPLACKLMKLLLQSLGLSDEDINSDNIVVGKQNELTETVRFNHYPACPESDRAMAMGAHTDSSLITILYQNNATGLQALMLTDGPKPTQWATFPAIKGSLIVILGDLFQIMTNGLFKSGCHRAVMNQYNARTSSAYFCLPGKAKVSPINKLVDQMDGPKYKSVEWHEYIGLKEKQFREALKDSENLKL